MLGYRAETQLLAGRSKHCNDAANSPPAASYGARRGHTPLAEPKSLPPDASNTENHVAALVEAIPHTHATAVPVNAATACLQPTQQ